MSSVYLKPALYSLTSSKSCNNESRPWLSFIGCGSSSSKLSNRMDFITCLLKKSPFHVPRLASHSTSVSADSEEDNEARRQFEKLKLEEINRINTLESFEKKSNLQMDRQHVMASEWCRKLLTLQGKLKGTEWDPEDSHNITFNEFWMLLDAKSIHFMEYSDFGKKVSVILPYSRKGNVKPSAGQLKEEIVFHRHRVEQMPVDCWNDIWKKLHKQLLNIDVYNVNSLSAEVYSTVATAVIWSMRFVLSVAFYQWIDSKMMPIYAKVIPCDLGTPQPVRKLTPPRQQQHDMLGSFGKSRAKFISAEETTGVTFDDFAGQEYIKKEMQELVDILRNAKELQKQGMYCPKGVLLHGPPGTGKTLLARAIAGEAGLPFFASNGTDFVEMFVGVAASRVKDLFATARSFAPAIIFIDEIDAIGCKRGGLDIGGGGAEREQGLLRILTEMDGFKASSEVLVIGATNRLDVLDPALLRKGRFDRIIRLGLPLKDGRLSILRVHARNKTFQSEDEKELLLAEIAEITEDFTGAELQNILNEAAILSARKGLEHVGREELVEAMRRHKGTFETGLEDSVDVPAEIKLRLAYREAAVAVLACYYPNPCRPFVETNIRTITSKSNLRYTDVSGKMFLRKSDFVESIVQSCAPRVIEEVVFGIDNLSWISSSVISDTASCIESLIMKTGMTAFGKVHCRNDHDLVPYLMLKLEALRDEYVRFAVAKCTSILREHRYAVERIADILLEEGEIKAERIWEVYKSSSCIPQPPVPSVDEYGALIYAGRWGIYGVTLPGRVTFAPGNVGFSTFGAPRPLEPQIIGDETRKLIDRTLEKRVQEIRNEVATEMKVLDLSKVTLLMADHFI